MTSNYLSESLFTVGVTAGWVTAAMDGVLSGAGVGVCGLWISKQQWRGESPKNRSRLLKKNPEKKTKTIQSHKTNRYQVSTRITYIAANNNSLHLSDWVVILSWGGQPLSSSPLGQWGIPSQRCPASMQPPGGGQEKWPAGQLRGLVTVEDGCVPVVGNVQEMSEWFLFSVMVCVTWTSIFKRYG